MSYEKKTWVNNQTKLSAGNMNHLEAGIEEAIVSAATANDLANSAKTSAESAGEAAAAAAEKAAEAGSLAETAQKSADDAAVTAGNAKAVADAAKESVQSAIDIAKVAESLANTAATSVGGKQDALVSGTSIKTINGESLLGSGDIEVAVDVETPYEELETADLNDLTEQGVYKIGTASNVPADTSASGTLHVNKLGDSHYEQLWYSDSNWARRISSAGDSPEPSPIPGVTYAMEVNGVKYVSSASAPMTIKLDAVKEYDVSGDLIGHIEITSSTEPVGPTKLRLKGVNILSDADSGIVYSPEKKKLVVEVFANSSNYISIPNGKEKDDAAAILSNSDVTITGTGFLALSTNLGHAIKASELIVNGEPKMSIDAVHDAFHASKILRISGGEFTIESCNDVFSAGSAEDNAKITVEMTITGGKFIINGSTDAIFQNKSTVGSYRIVKGDFEFASDGINEMFQEEDGGTKVNVYDLCSFTGLSDAQQAEVESRKIVLADQYGECKVLCSTEDGFKEIEPLGGEYSLNKGDELSYTISGNITGKTFVTADKKINISLKGVYCDETDESGTIMFDYQNVKSRLQVNVTEGYINYIKKNSGIIFHSNSNISLKLKESDATDTVPQKISIGYFSAPSGTVINAYCESTSEPSRSAIAGDGICYVTDSKIGVYADNLWLGNEYGDNGEADWGKGYISLYVKDNETDVSLIWKTTDEAKKAGYIYAPWYLLGTAIIGSNIVYADAGKKYFEAPSGTVDASYANTPIVYTTADVSGYDINAGVVHYDSDFTIESATDFDTTIVASSVDYGSWVVYKAPDNIYTKEEVDAEVAAAKEAAIAQAKADVAALMPKKVTLSADENVSKLTVYNYCSDSAVAEGELYEAPVYARDGDFGYPCIDGTGQVNFSLTLAEGYDALEVSGDTGNFKTFKTPYTTCKDGIYRLTKVTADSSVSLVAKKQSEMSSYAIGYKLVLPEGWAGALPTVTEYRTNDAMLENYAPSVIEFTDNAYVGKSYSKDTGYPDNSDGDAAQINFKVDWEAVDGYSLTVATSAQNYKKFAIDAEKNTYQATKIKGDFDVIITIASNAVMRNVTYTAGTYSFSTAADDIPAQVAEGSSLKFEFYHQTNCQNPTKDTTCVPDGTDAGGAGTLPTAEACLSRISSVTIGGEAYSVTADMIAVSGKKAAVTLPADAIVGDVAITLA